jgi:hypothetical protein
MMTGRPSIVGQIFIFLQVGQNEQTDFIFNLFKKKFIYGFFRGIYKYGRQLELFDKKNSKKAGQERSVPSSLWCCVRGYDGPPAATAYGI